MNSILKLKDSVNNYINSNESDSEGKDILELIELNFVELDSPKFGVTLSKYVINPIAKKLQGLNIEISSIGNSFSTRKRKKLLTNKCKQLTDTQDKIFNSYRPYLKENSYFQEYIDELNNKHSKYIEEILNGETHNDSQKSFMYPIYFSANKMQILTEETKEYIKRLNSDMEAYEFAKDKTITLYKRTKQTLEKIHNEKLKTEKLYYKVESKLKKVNKNETYEDTETGELHNVEEYYSELLNEYALELQNINQHELILKNLASYLNGTYLYLSGEETVSLNKITVFGDSNYEMIKRLSIGIKSLSFVSELTDTNDLFEVFLLNVDKTKKPINFTNGTLNDFGYLMLKLRPLFIDTISVKSEYGKWWAKHFTFKTKEKTKKEVSNMITAVERGERFSEKRKSINDLVDNLNPIPQ